MPSPSFGPHVASVLREYRKANPAMPADAFWSACAEIIERERKIYEADMFPDIKTPRITKKERAGVLFDALAEACGKSLVEMTKPEQQECAVMLASIKQVSPDVTPFEIKRRARLYKSRWPTWPLTISALCKRWSELGGGKTAARPDIYQEPDGWREAAARLFPTADFSDRTWADIRVTLGAQILAAM